MRYCVCLWKLIFAWRGVIAEALKGQVVHGDGSMCGERQTALRHPCLFGARGEGDLISYTPGA